MYSHLQKFRRNATYALLLGVLSPLSGVAAPLNEAEALRLGLSRPELAEIARARAGEAEAEVIEIGRWANPTLELSQDKTGPERETAWQLSQPVDFSGRRGLRQRAADQRLAAISAEAMAQTGDRAAELRKVFHETLRQQEALRATEAWASRFATIGSVVDKLAKAGEASGYDRRRLAREQQSAEARLAEGRADLARSRARLTALVGQGVTSNDGVTGILLPTMPDDLSSLQGKLAQRPDLVAYSARAEAADSDHTASRRWFPEVTIGIGGKRVDDGNTRETGTLFSVSIPLPVFDRQQSAERRTASQAMATRAEYAMAKQKAEGEIVGLHQQVTQLIVAAERYRREAVQPSTELIRVAEAAYRAGESTVLELLDAYKGALEAENTALDLEWKAREARIELDLLTGNLPQ